MGGYRISPRASIARFVSALGGPAAALTARFPIAAVVLGLCFAPAPISAQSIIRDAEIERTLRMLAAPVYDAGGLTIERVPIVVVNNRELNAFVTGANVMFLHSGMIVELETPEELIAVIAHEAAHVIERHIVTRIAAAETASSQAIVSTIIGIGAAVAGAGEAGAAGASVGQQIALRDLLSFTRAQEAGADQTGVRLMNEARIDPAAMLRVLERFDRPAGAFGVDPYAVTHPLGGARIRLLEDAVARSPARGLGVSDDMTYWHGRMRAKIDGFLTPISATTTPRRYGDPELDLYREAIYLYRLPDPDGAIAAIDQLLAMRPNDPYYWEMKGYILINSGRGADAIEPYRRAVELAPNEPLIVAQLGRALLFLETPEANAEALRLLERAVLADPYGVSMRRSLAIAYARAGDDGMAAVVTAERLALSGRISEAHIHAERARAVLPVGSPGWLRAEDILGMRPRD